MVSYFRRALNALLPDKTERKLELSGDTHFDYQLADFSSARHPTEEQIKDFILKRKTNTTVKIVNCGSITVTERIVIVEKSTLTEFLKNDKEAWAKCKKKSWKTDFKFVVKNKGNIHIVNNIYLILNDVDTFVKSEQFALLAEGITWESPVFIKKNTGTITKKVEVVAQVEEEEVKMLDQTLIDPSTFTESDKNIMKKLSIKGMDMECFKEAMCTISA